MSRREPVESPSGLLADDGAGVQMVKIYSCGNKFDVFLEVELCL